MVRVYPSGDTAGWSIRDHACCTVSHGRGKFILFHVYAIGLVHNRCRSRKSKIFYVIFDRYSNEQKSLSQNRARLPVKDIN